MLQKDHVPTGNKKVCGCQLEVRKLWEGGQPEPNHPNFCHPAKRIFWCWFNPRTCVSLIQRSRDSDFLNFYSLKSCSNRQQLKSCQSMLQTNLVKTKSIKGFKERGPAGQLSWNEDHSWRIEGYINCQGTRIIYNEGLSTNTLHRSITSRLVCLPFVLF